MKKVINLFICLLMVLSIVSPVSAIKSVPVKSIKLDKSSISLDVGKTYNLKVIFTPANTTQKLLIYFTSNKSIAAIDAKGKITAVKAGKAVITVTSSSNKKIIAKCNVTVTQVVSNIPKFPIVKDKITIKVYGARSTAQGPWEDTQVIKKMEELTNIHFVFDTPQGTAFTERKNLMLASGEIPDVFMGTALTVNEEETYGPQGVLIPLEKMIDKNAPYLAKRLKEDPGVQKAITSTDGHIYALPYVVRTNTMANGILYINMTWLNNVGMQKPKTVDELYGVLKAFKDKDPNKNGQNDEIPISAAKPGVNTTPIDSYILNRTILNAFSGQAGGNQFDVKNGKVVYNAAQPFYKDYLMYLNKLYKEGLLDNEMFTQAPQNMYAKGKEGRVGVLTASVTVMLNPDKYDPHELLDPLTSNINNKKVTAELPGIYPSVFAITSKCKYPEAVMKWVDVFYRTVNEEVSGLSGLAMMNGIRGVNWDFSDNTKQTYKYIKPAQYENLSNIEYLNQYVTPGGSTLFPSWVVTNASPEGTDPLLLLKAKECQKHYTPYMIPIYPSTVRYTKIENDTVGAVSNDIYTYTTQMMAKFVMGEESFNNWDSYIGNLKKMRLDDLTKVLQNAYKR